MKFTLTSGAYTPADAASILGVKASRVANLAWRHWWGKGYAELGEVKSLDFYTLMELKTYFALRDAGVSGQRIHKARKELIEDFDYQRPFANKLVLSTLSTDGKRVFIKVDQRPITLDGKKQFNLKLVQEFMADIVFGSDGLAERYAPSAAKGSVVIDPAVKYGRPVVEGTRIEAVVLAQMHAAGDSYELIADVYGLDETRVKQAISYASAA